MSQATALFRLLTAAPPRSAEVVKRVALEGLGPLEVGALFGVDLARAEVLVFRAFLDVHSGGAARLSDEAEATAVPAFFGRGEGGDTVRALRELEAGLRAHREALEAQLEAAARAWESSPARAREEWLRRAAIVLVLALSAFFYWREQHKPRPPPERRPTVIPSGKG